MIELKDDKDFGSAMTDEYRTELTNAVYNKLKLFDRLSTEITTSMDVGALKVIKARADSEGIAVHLTHIYKMFKDGGIQRADLN